MIHIHKNNTEDNLSVSASGQLIIFCALFQLVSILQHVCNIEQYGLNLVCVPQRRSVIKSCLIRSTYSDANIGVTLDI